MSNERLVELLMRGVAEELLAEGWGLRRISVSILRYIFFLAAVGCGVRLILERIDQLTYEVRQLAYLLEEGKKHA